MAERTYPVMEVFGPTIQGEGPEAGVPCYFVRFGGCDYRCAWCDSMHAVEPALVRANSRKLTTDQIVAELDALTGGPAMTVLSGGNPALLELGELVQHLQWYGQKVAVETQGSRWKPWLADVDRLVVSPKPPSSGMVNERQGMEFGRFIDQLSETDAVGKTALKVVVFDGTDLVYAERLWGSTQATHSMPLYLSAGTPVEHQLGSAITDDQAKASILTRYRWLAEEVAQRPALAHATVLPQLHVLAWGQALGV